MGHTVLVHNTTASFGAIRVGRGLEIVHCLIISHVTDTARKVLGQQSRVWKSLGHHPSKLQWAIRVQGTGTKRKI